MAPPRQPKDMDDWAGRHETSSSEPFPGGVDGGYYESGGRRPVALVSSPMRRFGCITELAGKRPFMELPEADVVALRERLVSSNCLDQLLNFCQC